MEKKITLNNGSEADLITMILKDLEIEHVVISYHDSAMDGLWQTQKGWGYLGIDESNESEVIKVLDELRSEKYEDTEQ